MLARHVLHWILFLPVVVIADAALFHPKEEKNVVSLKQLAGIFFESWQVPLKLTIVCSFLS
jgi:hypothetical protein